MFLCCQVGLLGPFGSAWGRGRVPAAPRLGPHPGTWTPSALHRALSPPGVPRARSGQLLPGTVSRLSVEEKLVLTPPPWGLMETPPPLPRRAQEERRSVTTCESSRGVFFGPSPASPASSAEGCSPYHPRLWLTPPAPRGGIGRTPLWCHINMYMCI